jgi:hypothetical protein
MSEGAERARLYLDVDGVINAVHPGTPPFGWPESSRQRINGYPITWAPAFVDLLNRVAETPGLGVYWLTTWCFDAPSILAPALGLKGEKWPVVGYDHWRRATGLPWWKHLAIVEHLDGFTGPVLWIDDDHGSDPACRAWLSGQPQVLTMDPVTSLGVTRDQATIIERFADLIPGATS